MTFEARERRKILKMLLRNVVYMNLPKYRARARASRLKQKRVQMHIFIRCVARPNYHDEEILKRLGVTFITKEQFRKLISHGEIEDYDFKETRD